MKDNTFGFYLMNKKGLLVLQSVFKKFSNKNIAFVVSSKDKNLLNDFYEEIKCFCFNNNIIFFDKSENIDVWADYVFAIGWRWLIKEKPEMKIIVLHDSLLPKYRGFSPIVTALINGEEEVGVTALTADAEYDKGDIIVQKSMRITYPIKIKNVIDDICNLYENIVLCIMENLIFSKDIINIKQKNEEATYSLWRDEDDYFIDWNKSSFFIKRFIDVVGDPYLGALSYVGKKKIRILDAEVVNDLKIENRDIGKVIHLLDGCPCVVCGEGIIKINDMIDDETREQFVLPRFRVRFGRDIT